MKTTFFNPLRKPLNQLAALILASALAPVTLALTATADAPMRDPWVPLETRKAAATAPASAPTSGAELQAQVERKLKQAFDAAVVNSDGTLTSAQANAAGLGFVVKHFAEIDQGKRGVVRFEDVMRFMNARSAAAGLSHR